MKLKVSWKGYNAFVNCLADGLGVELEGIWRSEKD